MTNKYLLHSKGCNWFHFRSDIRSAMGSFSVTYCHDGTVCMTGDMGCLTWQREYFPKTPDYGFPFAGNGIDYFAEKVVRADTLQIIRTWDRDLAISQIATARMEDRSERDYCTLSRVYDCLSGFESGEYGYFQMLEEFNDTPHDIECEEYCEYGRCYDRTFETRFEMLRSVSDMIIKAMDAEKRDKSLHQQTVEIRTHIANRDYGLAEKKA